MGGWAGGEGGGGEEMDIPKAMVGYTRLTPGAAPIKASSRQHVQSLTFSRSSNTARLSSSLALSFNKRASL